MFIRRVSLAFAVVSTCSAIGCAAEPAEDGDLVAASAADLTQFEPDSCASPRVTSAPKQDSGGNPIDGTARTTLDGCILAAPGETGAQLLARATALLSDTNRFGALTDDGEPVFSSFRPRTPSGSLPTGLVQDVDVRLNASFSPSTRLRVTRQSGTASMSLSIANVTPVKATVIFPVTAVKPGNLTMKAVLKTERNGITVSGISEVALEVEKDRAQESTELVQQVFTWLSDQLTSRAPESDR